MENNTMNEFTRYSGNRGDAISDLIQNERIAQSGTKRLKRIISHVGLSRYMATLETTMLVTPRIAAIPSPYAFSPTHTIYQNNSGPKPIHVIVIETAHKQYDVFDASNLPLRLAEAL
jgi:hypothetical protein